MFQADDRLNRWQRHRVARMTRHFLERWQERVGSVPTLEEINAILSRSQRIRRQMRCMVRRGGALVPHKILAEYWNHPMGLVLLVDEERGAAVTVISADGGERDDDMRAMRASQSL